MRGSVMAVASTKKKSVFVDGVTGGIKVKQLPFMGIICTVLFIVFRTTNYLYEQTEMESKMGPFYSSKDSDIDITHLNSLPHGIMHARSDLELKPLWSTSHSKSKLFSLPLNLSIRSFPLLPKVIHFQYQAFEGFVVAHVVYNMLDEEGFKLIVNITIGYGASLTIQLERFSLRMSLRLLLELAGLGIF
ncbi:hypothetical protein FXO38_19875 [Capsicum annuum]|nr:hypothetical protein FXO38_19875 [Capsicum annuum]